MTELKTKPTEQQVDQFLSSIDDAVKRQDCLTIMELMREATGEEPRMWGPTIVGFGQQHYRYESGREGDWFITGFSPRKQNLTLYLTYGFEQQTDLLEKLGKHTIGKACLYIKRLDQVDKATLHELIKRSVAQHRERAEA